jgi:hypothetical protein
VSRIPLGEEDGFVVVEFEGAEFRLDLFDANDKIRDAIKDREGAAAGTSLIAAMKDMGLPEVSRRVAVRFANGIMRPVADCEKKVSGPAPSAGSTASTPAP